MVGVDLGDIKKFILDNILTNVDDIKETESVFLNGVIDSFGLLDVVFFIKSKYHVEIEMIEFSMNGIDNLTQLNDYIKNKK